MPEINLSGLVRDLSDVELRAEVLSGLEGRLNPARALAEFAVRQPDAGLEEAARALEDRKSTPDLRRVAIETLGRSTGKVARAALVANLGTKLPAEQRDTLRSLGRIGGPEELEVVQSLRPGLEVTLAGTAVAAARLIAFRHGIPGVEFKRPTARDRIELPDDGLKEMKSQPANPEEVMRTKLLVPGLKLIPENVVEMQCLGARLWFVNTDSLREGGLDRVREVPQVAAVIMAYGECPGGFYHSGYVMSQPGEDGAELYVTRLRGDVTHFGTAKIGRGAASFEVEALRSRLAPAARLSGAFAGAEGGMRFERALVSTDRKPQLELRRGPGLIAERPRLEREPAGPTPVDPVIAPSPN